MIWAMRPVNRRSWMLGAYVEPCSTSRSLILEACSFIRSRRPPGLRCSGSASVKSPLPWEVCEGMRKTGMVSSRLAMVSPSWSSMVWELLTAASAAMCAAITCSLQVVWWQQSVYEVTCPRPGKHEHVKPRARRLQYVDLCITTPTEQCTSL